jgi:hypothetical protein
MTKLGQYLKRNRLSHRAFARAAGIPHLHPMVGLWARGVRFPGRDTALAVETATRGEVPASYWGGLKRRGSHGRSIRQTARKC